MAKGRKHFQENVGDYDEPNGGQDGPADDPERLGGTILEEISQQGKNGESKEGSEDKGEQTISFFPESFYFLE
jgi:hypothetical protein